VTIRSLCSMRKIYRKRGRSSKIKWCSSRRYRSKELRRNWARKWLWV